MGALVYKHFKVLVGLPVVAIVASTSVRSEDLLLPYTCAVEHGVVRLQTAAETRYRILGKREEQIFTICPSGPAAACSNIMIHRFHVLCGSERVSWARIAHGAHNSGIELPRELPTGFAPVTPFGARFVLPALAPVYPPATPVMMQELSPDGVVDHAVDAATPAFASWTTIVKSDIHSEAGGGAARVAAAVAALMLALLGASYVAAGRWRVIFFEIEEFRRFLYRFARLSATRLSAIRLVASQQCARFYAAWRASGETDASFANALAMANTSFANTETAVAALPVDLLLRDVLSTELNGVRLRLRALEIEQARKPAVETNAQIRRAMRELDRIVKIAQSAVHSSTAGARGEETVIPQSVMEAYQVLGLNRNAAPEIAKKLVDALRMSWHPDYAQDDADRHRRENRMKQINAAWDIVNGRREAA